MPPQYGAATAKAKREREEMLEDTVKRIQVSEFESISEVVRETEFPKMILHGRLHGAKLRNKV